MLTKAFAVLRAYATSLLLRADARTQTLVPTLGQGVAAITGIAIAIIAGLAFLASGPFGSAFDIVRFALFVATSAIFLIETRMRHAAGDTSLVAVLLGIAGVILGFMALGMVLDGDVIVPLLLVAFLAFGVRLFQRARS